jgi:RNA polymerase sigma factor (sigma-70 family)
MSVHLPPFQRLVDDHWRDVARLATALCGPIDGPDVAQQAWLQAYAAYPRLTSTRNLRGWLFTVTHRCAMDSHRARARNPVPTPSDELPERPASRAAPGTGIGPIATPTLTDPAEAYVARDPDLWAAVNTLPPRTRDAVVLRYVADLDHAHIARIIDTSSGMSRRLVSDGLAALRKALTDD